MTCNDVITRSLVKAAGKSFGDNQWGLRHVNAWHSPRPLERAIVGLCKALAEYADDHQQKYESTIGEDGVLGKEWLAIMQATRGLLNGELGRLDAGTVDGLLVDMARAAGFTEKELE